MSAKEVLKRLVEKLDTAGVPFMVAGSFASTYHGVPRSTQDIDLVIDPTARSLDALLADLPDPEYYVDPEVAREAMSRRSQFNVIDLATGWKVDFVIRKDRPFSLEEFRRRELADLLGVKVFVATAEDAVLSKLEWAKLGDSERQLRDVEGILSVRGAGLDRAYIEDWVSALGVSELWERVRRGP